MNDFVATNFAGHHVDNFSSWEEKSNSHAGEVSARLWLY
jgi:hypothetical protein